MNEKLLSKYTNTYIPGGKYCLSRTISMTIIDIIVVD